MRKLIQLHCFMLLLWGLPLFALSQTRVVSGKVTNASGELVPLATIQLKGTSKFATADGTGHFTISVTGASPVLVVSSVGYQPVEVPVTSATSYDVSLKENPGR